LSFTTQTCVQVHRSQTVLDLMTWSASFGNYLEVLVRRTIEVAEMHVRPLF